MPGEWPGVELTGGVPLDHDDALDLLREGELGVLGRLVDASNATLYCSLTGADRTAACVYKPIVGERPLWDFPDGTLAYREVAAYAVSAASGWRVVPPTVLRDGPFGTGMVQWWVDVPEDTDVSPMLRSGHPALRRMALFDAVVNNADRKGGHLLPVDGGKHIYGVDHGVCFSTETKLRTVLWRWRGRPIADAECQVLRHLRVALDGSLGETLRGLLAPEEVAATVARVDQLLSSGVFPHPSSDWPAVPWPPF